MKIVIADVDDWRGLYINGVLVYQDHSIPLDVLVNEISTRLPRLDISFEAKEVDYEWMDTSQGGYLPDNLEEVKFNND